VSPFDADVDSIDLARRHAQHTTLFALDDQRIRGHGEHVSDQGSRGHSRRQLHAHAITHMYLAYLLSQCGRRNHGRERRTHGRLRR
jgi:hypothetical protein